jgi:hypothetical protein
MKKITFSADDDLIERARLIARSQHKTLNAAFGNGYVRLPPNRVTSGNLMGS